MQVPHTESRSWFGAARRYWPLPQVECGVHWVTTVCDDILSAKVPAGQAAHAPVSKLELPGMTAYWLSGHGECPLHIPMLPDIGWNFPSGHSLHRSLAGEWACVVLGGHA